MDPWVVNKNWVVVTLLFIHLFELGGGDPFQFLGNLFSKWGGDDPFSVSGHA